jgi:hypothetical protein
MRYIERTISKKKIGGRINLENISRRQTFFRILPMEEVI